LILCDSDEEARDRLLLSGIREPAHICICNAVFAHLTTVQHKGDIKALFIDADAAVDHEDVVLAIRPDWQGIGPVLNDSLRFILNAGGLKNRLEKVFPGKLADLASFPR
jgi:hypothetical protein